MDSKILEQNLKCPICLTLAENPYESSCCGHIFCNRCTRNINKVCPICRNEKFTFRENFFAKRLLTEVKVKCHFGCDENIEFAQMKVHRFTCDKLIFKCKIKECTVSGNKQEILKHISEEHSEYIISMAENYSTFDKKMDKLINEGTKSEADIKKKKKEEEVKEINEITKRYINKYKSSPLRHFPTSPLRNYHKTKSEDSSIESPLNYVNNYNHNQRDSPHPNHLSLSPGSNNNYSPIEHSVERANNINTHWVEDIMTLTKCTKEKAMLSLIDSDGDIVGAIMKITSEMNENEENKNNNEI